ncbi:MAG: hypothetical protein LAO31_13570 [Acidobacteriia bacterium]|nr:hypothetical protein [Terriglobia bacterium]
MNDTKDTKPSDQTIHPQPIYAYLTPLAFHNYSTQYLTVARAARGESGFSPVPYYLYCRSLELSMKAYLLAKGVEKTELKKRSLGHDLNQILGKGETLGLGTLVKLTDEERREVSKANVYYVHKEFEYANVLKTVQSYPGLPDLGILDVLANRLLTAVHPICLSA